MYFIGLVWLIILILAITILLLYLIYIIYINSIPGAFYYPSTQDTVKKTLKLIKPKKNELLYDLGSGNGNIVIEAAKLGIKSIGFELNPLLIYKSRKKIHQLGLSHLAQIKYKSFWRADFNQADIIYIYQFPKYMTRLENILNQKINHPVKVISNTYPFPNKKPALKENNILIYQFP